MSVTLEDNVLDALDYTRRTRAQSFKAIRIAPALARTCFRWGSAFLLSYIDFYVITRAEMPY